MAVNISEYLKKIAEATEKIAEHNMTADELDRYYAALLDDTNTQAVFRAWYQAAFDTTKTQAEQNYALLDRFAKMLALNNDSVHTVRFYAASISSETRGTPLDDLAGKKAQVFATDAGIVDAANQWADAEGNNRTDGEDWATENRLTWYVRANALSLADGTMSVLAIEGVNTDFDIRGEIAPVYTFALSPYFKEEYTADGYEINSWAANPKGGYHPFNENVNTDGSRRFLTWHPAFCGSAITKTDSGTAKTYLTSGAGHNPYNFASANQGLTVARNWNSYEGVGADANARWALYEFRHRHFNKENSNINEGCLSYNFQYRCALAETDATRVLLTTAQGANIVVGANVEIGDNESTSAPDRGAAQACNTTGKRFTKVLSVETVSIDGTEYAAVELELDAPITTTTTTWVSSMPWNTGATETLAGHHLDGSPVNLKNGKYPLRIAGMEVLIGLYQIGLDILYNCTATDESGKYDYAVYECRNSEHLAGSITANYTDTGISFEKMPQGWQYVKEFVKTSKPVLFPKTIGGNSTGYLKSAFDGSGGAGVRCPWRFGGLSGGGYGGLAYGVGSVAPSYAYWGGAPWLAGAEKKRGEYAGI